MTKVNETDKLGIRIEVRLSADISEKLDFCTETLNRSKAGIIRAGIEKMYESANREKELVNARLSREALVAKAKEERRQMVYGAAYENAYANAYAEEYARLIINPAYTPSQADAVAIDYAEDIASDEADEAVIDFWDS